jgi:hypothetical protein
MLNRGHHGVARLLIAVQAEVRHVVGHDASHAGRAQRGLPFGGGTGGEQRRQQLFELESVLRSRFDSGEARVGREVVTPGGPAQTRERVVVACREHHPTRIGILVASATVAAFIDIRRVDCAPVPGNGRRVAFPRTKSVNH